MPKRKNRSVQTSVGSVGGSSGQSKKTSSSGVPKYERADNKNGCHHLVSILSPAKTLNLRDMAKDNPISWTTPSCDSEKRRQIVEAMQRHARNLADLRKILNVSASLAETAKKYWMAMDLESGTNSVYESKACGYSFDGVAYKGLDMHSLSNNDVSYLQDHLRIVDPLYGWLRPMDAIEPYRLEMASRGVLDDVKVKNGKSKGLAEFWKPAVRISIEQLESKLPTAAKILIVNLASDEYSAAVDWPSSQIVKVVFRHAGRVLAVHAKRARGLMVRYMAEHNVQSLEDLTKFDHEGYQFQADESSILLDGNESPLLVFDRTAASAPASKKKKN